jgi:hypothetical protein
LNTSYVQGQSVEYGEFKPALLTGNGPASYSLAAGDVIYNPASGDYINFPSDCMTQSGLYCLSAFPVTAGQIRAGATSPSQSGWAWRWFNSGSGGVLSVAQNVAGSSMVPGTYPLIFSGSGGAAGFVTVLTATTIATPVITAAGSYASAPTATVATGGTPVTLTVTAAPTTTGQVTAATNLSAQVVQFGAIVSQL